MAGRCAGIARAVSGHPKMIEAAVALARKGLERMDRALDGLSGPLEAQPQTLLTTGLAQVGEEGRRIWSLLPLFPAGNAMPEALAVVARGLDARAAGEDFAPSGTGEALPDWAEAGLEQLEHAAFVDWDPERRLYTFHQTVLEQARREAGLDEETRVYALAWLLAFYGLFVMAHDRDYPAIERCLDNALPLMEAAWWQRGEADENRTLFVGRMADALGDFFIHRGLWAEGETWTERAVGLRRLWERSLKLSGALGDRAGKAITLCMLAQVEEMDGNWDRARTLARQAVDDLERIGHDQAADAREVLADIEAKAAAGGSEPSDPMAMLGELLTLPPQKGIRRVDQALASNPGPAKAVTLWLARATLCSRRHDASGLEQGLVRAREAVERVTGRERRSLEALVRQAESGVAELRQAGAAAESVRLHREGVERAKAGDLPGALGRFEAALAASRAEGHGYNAAASLLAMGRALLLLERPAEALERLREGLAVAEPLGNEELLDAPRPSAYSASSALNSTLHRAEFIRPDK